MTAMTEKTQDPNAVLMAVKDALTLISRIRVGSTWMRSDEAIVKAGLGVIVDYEALAATATTQPVAAPEPTLQNWLTIIHDNELSLGDRLQRLSVRISGILRGDAPDKFQPHAIRDQCNCALDYERTLADHGRLVRELDVLLNGEEGAAKQASLCDIVAQVRREGFKAAPVQAAADEVREGRVVSITPGVGLVAIEVGRLPEWLDLGCQVCVTPAQRTTSTKGEKGGAA
jgi:hypothetical protein